MKERIEGVKETERDVKRLRTLTWEDYGISKGRYKELQGFCIQYRQKQKDAKRLGDYALAAVTEAEVVDGTNEAFLRYQSAKRAIRDCRMIEEAAMWAANDAGYKSVWRAIIRNVTDGIGYDNLCRIYYLPFSVADFYGIRRAFFHRLNQLRNDTELDEK